MSDFNRAERLLAWRKLWPHHLEKALEDKLMLFAVQMERRGFDRGRASRENKPDAPSRGYPPGITGLGPSVSRIWGKSQA